MKAVFFKRFDLCDELPTFGQTEEELFDYDPDDMDLDLSDAGDDKTVLD
jgi:hypothetical protein